MGMSCKWETKLRTWGFALVWLVFIGGQSLEASSLEVCKGLAPGRDSQAARVELLEGVQSKLIQTSSTASTHLEAALECLREDSEVCEHFRNKLRALLEQQIGPIKMYQSLAQVKVSNLSYLSRQALLNLIQEERLRPTMIGDYLGSRFNFSGEEKEQSLRLWQSFALEHMAAEIDAGKFKSTRSSCAAFHSEPSVELIGHLRSGFHSAAQTFIQTNPLLAFLSERDIDNWTAVEEAFEELIAINEEFRQEVAELRVEHGEYWLSPSEFKDDHEMGLMNFSSVAEKIISELPEEPARANACSAWDTLSRQQSAKIKASIGLGFGTAVFCGVGLWSGVGTLPALGFCSFAIADSVWGAKNGWKNHRMATLSMYSGRRSLDVHGKENDEIRSFARAAELQGESGTVVAVNVLGLVPILKGLSAVAAKGKWLSGLTKAQRGSYRTLAVVPASDSSVSVAEVNAARLATLVELANPRRKPAFVLKQGYADVFEFARGCERLLD